VGRLILQMSSKKTAKLSFQAAAACPVAAWLRNFKTSKPKSLTISADDDKETNWA
jgi:hypothetical protein